MTLMRLIAILLVLLQSLLAAVHAHSHSTETKHTTAPHLHACELLELFTSAHDHEDTEHKGNHHDSDAMELADILESPTPPSLQAITIDLTPVELGLVFGAAPVLSPFTIGWPHSTAGPHAPLYISYCTFRN